MNDTDLNFTTYHEFVRSVKVYPNEYKNIYPALKLNGEAGEVAEKIGKIIRDKKGLISVEDEQEIMKELGDVLWYIAALADDLGHSLFHVANLNQKKLLDRKNRNKLHGSGDNR